MKHITTPKDRCLVTAVVRSGQPECKVVAPEGADWQHLARRVAVRTRELTRVQPLHTTPDNVAEDDLRQFHVFAVGNAMNNDFISRLYREHFCFTDESYPGGHGFEVRTIHDPFGYRKNVVLIGGSTFEGVKRGIDFITRGLHRMNVAPHLQWGEDDLAIARLNFSESALHDAPEPPNVEARQRFTEESIATFKPQALGFDTAMHRVCDFGFYYYQTDREEWAEAFKSVLVRLAELVQAEGGWNLTRWGATPFAWLWKLIVVWDLIEESLCFTEEERAAIDNLLLQIARAFEGVPLSSFGAVVLRRIQERKLGNSVSHNPVEPRRTCFGGGRDFALRKG